MSGDRYPEHLLYTEEHEWIRTEGDRVTVGITWFAQDQLGDVVYVEVPEVGRHLKANEPFGVVESVKTVSDVYAPVAGEVLAVNERLQDEPELVNQEPYGEGWLMVLRLEEAAQLAGFMDAQAYRAMVEGDA